MLLGYLCQHMSKLPSELLTGSTIVQETIAQVRAPQQHTRLPDAYRSMRRRASYKSGRSEMTDC